MCEDIRKALNTGSFPSYFNDGRLIPLSKVSGKTVVTVDDIRPIVVKAHLLKVCERAILNKLEGTQSSIFSTGRYQSGFKKQKSTMDNLAIVIEKLMNQRKRKTKRKITVFVDL